MMGMEAATVLSQTMAAVGWAAVQLIWQGSLIGLAAVMAMRAGRRRWTPRQRRV